jgi:predicted transcriptional regulator
LRNKIAVAAQEATMAKFVKQLGNAALEDREKRIQFGLEWCKDGEFKFVYSGYENGVSDFFYYWHVSTVK